MRYGSASSMAQMACEYTQEEIFGSSISHEVLFIKLYLGYPTAEGHMS